MYEQLFLNRLKQYQDSNLSLDRIIVDPMFKDMPLAEKVDLLKKHGHTIRQGSKTDSRFWKDIGWGSVATAVMLAPAVTTSLNIFTTGRDYGAELSQAMKNGETPPAMPELDFSGYKDIAKGVGAATSLGLFAPKIYAAIKARNNMRLVQKLLSEQPENNTQDVAINVIARS